MRFTVPEAKNGFHTARAIQARLERIDGALLASVNPKTGDALLLYEQRDITHEQMAARVRQMGYLRDNLGLVQARRS